MSRSKHHTDGYDVHTTHHDNGAVKGEVWSRNGVPDGRLRGWDEEGVLITEQFFIRGKRVSKKKYAAAANEDEDIRAFEESEIPWSESTSKSLALSASSLGGVDLSRAVEARVWLSGVRDQRSAAIGSMAPGETELFIEELYVLGAIKVLIPFVDVTADESRADMLVIELPNVPDTRALLIEHLNRVNASAGFDALADSGDSYFAIRPA